ncbi:MAG: PilT-like protein [Caulobacteraceae bacterium]|nr:PilT-like protein [Caulobacteraceae bacterium]
MISLDTNILVYVAQDDEPARQSTALQLVLAARRLDCPLGLQVIGELQNVLRRKLRLPPWKAAQEARNVLESFRIFPATERAASEALSLMAAGRLSYWDALLLISARQFGVTHMLSEDMQDGALYGGVTIVNPFGSDGALSDRAREMLEL